MPDTYASGQIISAPLSTPGAGYTSVPSVAIIGGFGGGATITARLTPAGVNTTFAISSGGRGYSGPPVVRFASVDGNGSGATATCTVVAGVVTAVTRTAAGSGYTQPPLVAFDGSDGSGATATSLLVGTTVASLLVTNGGTGYTGTPTISIVGGSPSSGASCTAPVINNVGAPAAKIYDSFAGKGTQALGVADSGQTWGNFGAGANLPTIVNGLLTSTQVGAVSAAGYAEIQLPSNVARIGSTFSFGPKSTVNGGIAMPIWKTTCINYVTVPDSPCHLVITPDSWKYGYFNGGVISNGPSGTFSPALLTNGTVYRAEVTIAGDTATLLITTANGTPITATTITDSRIISNAGPYACFEIYASAANTDSKGSFSTVWADDSDSQLSKHAASRSQDASAMARAFAAMYIPTVVYYRPATVNNITFPNGAAANLDATNLVISCVAPPSGKVLVEVYGMLSATTRTLFGLQDELGGNIGQNDVCNGSTVQQQVYYSHLITGLAQGTLKTWILRGWTPSGTSILQCDAGNGRTVTMKASPIP